MLFDTESLRVSQALADDCEIKRVSICFAP
jgi:hypothetical protein